MILIVGRGYVAQYLQGFFGAAAQISEVDITKLAELELAVARHKPEVIINAAGKTNTAQLEKPEFQEEGFRVNVHGPANLQYVCAKYSIYWVHISTGMMYDGGTFECGLPEDAIHSPTNYYAWTKTWADGLLASMGSQGAPLTVRIQTPISSWAHPKNLVTKLLGFKEIIDVPNSLTVLEDCVPALAALIKWRVSGVYNLVNPEPISAYKIANMAQGKGLIAADTIIKPISREQLDRMVSEKGGARQTFSILSTAKLEKVGIHLPPTAEAVEKLLTNYRV